jgi:hypothetical protein
MQEIRALSGYGVYLYVTIFVSKGTVSEWAPLWPLITEHETEYNLTQCL